MSLSELIPKLKADASLKGETLYKANVAFLKMDKSSENIKKLMRDDVPGKIFGFVQKVYTGYMSGSIGANEDSFVFELVALLSTLVNQTLFSENHSNQLLNFLGEVLAYDHELPEDPKLKMENERLRELKHAVNVIATFNLEAEPAKEAKEAKEGKKASGRKPRKARR